MIILIVGYTSGLIHKFFYSLDWITVLYVLNLIMVSIDLALYYKYKNNAQVI